MIKQQNVNIAINWTNSEEQYMKYIADTRHIICIGIPKYLTRYIMILLKTIELIFKIGDWYYE